MFPAAIPHDHVDPIVIDDGTGTEAVSHAPDAVGVGRFTVTLLAPEMLRDPVTCCGTHNARHFDTAAPVVAFFHANSALPSTIFTFAAAAGMSGTVNFAGSPTVTVPAGTLAPSTIAP